MEKKTIIIGKLTYPDTPFARKLQLIDAAFAEMDKAIETGDFKKAEDLTTQIFNQIEMPAPVSKNPHIASKIRPYKG